MDKKDLEGQKESLDKYSLKFEKRAIESVEGSVPEIAKKKNTTLHHSSLTQGGEIVCVEGTLIEKDSCAAALLDTVNHVNELKKLGIANDDLVKIASKR